AAKDCRRYYLCAMIGVLALAAAPIADAQSARRRSASIHAETPQGRPKAAPPLGEDARGVLGGVLPAGMAWTGAQDVAIYALGMIGVDYRFGGSTPESGVDCSGLVQHVFRQVTCVTLPRTSTE